MNDNGLKIDRPVRPGYVFSHWSAVKPGSTTRVNRADGTVVEMPNDCPPFDFSKEVITKDTNLYAVFIPEVKVHFINGDEEIATENTVYGGKAYDPTPDGLRSLIEEGEELENAASHNSHKATPINKNDGVPKFGPYGQAI
jgi:hypothetical protein